ncbi:MAG: hypothetical protein ACE5HK_07555 [Candidatus Methylomirabilales bacterium]
MSNLISGVIAVLVVVTFLGYYAVRLESIPLWIIIVGVLAMILLDFVQSLRNGQE